MWWKIFVEKSLKGIDIFRIFDALNDVNLEASLNAVKTGTNDNLLYD